MVVDVYTLNPRFIEAYNNLKQIVEKQSVVLGLAECCNYRNPSSPLTGAFLY